VLFAFFVFVLSDVSGLIMLFRFVVLAYAIALFMFLLFWLFVLFFVCCCLGYGLLFSWFDL